MTSVSVLIPTVSGREPFLEMCVSGYLRNTAGVDLEFVILRDRPTCGVGWQEAAERASGEYLHFSNDDVLPRSGWLGPLIHTVAYWGDVAAPWIQHGSWGGFYGASPELGQEDTGAGVDHSAMPFCSRAQFERIGPIIATHYGVDEWIGERVRAAGMSLIGRRESVIDHWNVQIGREKGDWTQIDLLDYDCGIALPEYRAGVRPPNVMPPDRLTPEGLLRARQWRKENVL